MSRSVSLSVVGIIVLLFCTDSVDAQRFRNRGNDCTCPTTAQQYYQPNYQQRYAANYQRNYRPLVLQRNYVAQRVPANYYQQRLLVNNRNVQNPQMRYQQAVQYSPATRCWVPVQQYRTPTGVVLVPARQQPAARPAPVASTTTVNPQVAAPSNVRPATLEQPVEDSTPPLTAPQETKVVQPASEPESSAQSVLDRGN